MKVKSESEVAQSCPTLSDPMDCSLPGSSVHGIFQARALEWGAIVPPFPQLLNGENNATHHLGLLWILSYQIIHVLRTYNKHSVNISYSYQYVTIIIMNYHSCEFKLGNVERQNWLSVGVKNEKGQEVRLGYSRSMWHACQSCDGTETPRVRGQPVSGERKAHGETQRACDRDPGAPGRDGPFWEVSRFLRHQDAVIVLI